MHPKGIDTTVQARHEMLRKKKEQEEKVKQDFEEAFQHEVSKSSKKSNGSTDVDSPGGSGAGSPFGSKKDEKKKDYKSNKNASKAERSMLEMLAVEHVYRNNKNVDIQYLRRRALEPMKEHIESHLKKGTLSPHAKTSDTSGGAYSPAKVSKHSSISYPAMVGMSSESHSGVGDALLDKRKLTNRA